MPPHCGLSSKFFGHLSVHGIASSTGRDRVTLQAGYDSRDGVNFYQLSSSVDLVRDTNVARPGRWTFNLTGTPQSSGIDCILHCVPKNTPNIFVIIRASVFLAEIEIRQSEAGLFTHLA